MALEPSHRTPQYLLFGFRKLQAGSNDAIAPTSPRAPWLLQSILQTTCVDITLILAVAFRVRFVCMNRTHVGFSNRLSHLMQTWNGSRLSGMVVSSTKGLPLPSVSLARRISPIAAVMVVT
ncbi:hypothetical protein R6Q59_032354 [Mikania micrantha]